MPAVIDMRDLGRVNDPTFDNTAALLAGLARRDAGEPLELYFAPGEWYFSGQLPVNSHADLTIFDNVSISGQFTAPSVQHQEEGGGGTQNDRTRFLIALANESDVWWNHIRDYRFGPLAFRDITFRLTNFGSVFAFGDPDNAQHLKVTLRALYFDRCYMTRAKQYGTAAPGGQPWLIDAGGSPSRGEVLDKTINNFAVRLQRCYDTRLDLYIRGFRYGVINIQGDRVSGALRGILNGKLLEEYGMMPSPPNVAPVGGQWQSIYSEASVFAGAIINGQVAQLRLEFGYGSSFTPPTGPRYIPADVTWTIASGASAVVFAFPGGWGYNCTDYFEPRMPYRFTPSDASEPYRWLYVTKVEANQLTFADHTSKSYVKNPIGGDGSGVLRPFGIGVILDGDRASVIDPSVGCNLPRSNSPTFFARPQKKPIKIGGNADGANENPDNCSNLPVIIASCVGITKHLQGGVDFLGSAGVASHPLANVGGIGPVYDTNNREAIWDPNTRTQLFRPGRGVDSWADVSRDLMFHWWGDPDDQIGQNESFTISDVSPTAASFKIGSAYSTELEAKIIGRAILFTGGTLDGLVANVMAVTDGGSGTSRLTVRGLAAAPSNGNTLRAIGPPIGCYRPTDRATYGWMLRRVREKDKATGCQVRAYLPSGSATLNVSGGSGSPNSHTLTQGWQTVTSRLTAAQMAGDSFGPYISLTGTGAAFYLSWALVDQNAPVYSGTYTPVITAVQNVTSPSGYDCQYSRVGNVVTVSGMFSVSPVSVNTNTRVSIELPIPCNFSAAESCGGSLFGIGTPGVGGSIAASPSLDKAVGQWWPPSTGVTDYVFHFTYLIE